MRTKLPLLTTASTASLADYLPTYLCTSTVSWTYHTHGRLHTVAASLAYAHFGSGAAILDAGCPTCVWANFKSHHVFFPWRLVHRSTSSSGGGSHS